MATALATFAAADLAILAWIATTLARPGRTPPAATEGEPAMPFAVGDRVNVLDPFKDAMPDKDGGYLIVSVNSYVDGLTGQVGQTCSLAADDPRDFAGQYLEPYTPPAPPEE